jgi:hypothetical protein
MKRAALSAGAFVAVLSVSGVFAQTATYKVELKSSEEVPPNTSKGAGTANVTYDPATKLLSWKISYSALTGPATMGHIHGPAEAGKNAAVVIPFAKVDSPIEGSATLSDAQAADLKDGKLYINIHTAENKGGEIRAQLMGGK